MPTHRLTTRLATALVAGAMTALALTGCTSGPKHPSGPTAARCRHQWQQLNASVQQVSQSRPSDLGPRWTTLGATVQYYATSARPKDCGSTLSGMKQTIGRTRSMMTRLRPFDMVYRTAVLAPKATSYLSNPLPKPRKVKHKHGQTRVVPPPKKKVRQALKLLRSQAKKAATDMQDGWDEADQVDLTDAKAVKHLMGDMRFLAGDSTPYQACLPAVKVLQKAASFE